MKWLSQADMPNNQRSKWKTSTTKNINWLVKQYALAIPLDE